MGRHRVPRQNGCRNADRQSDPDLHKRALQHQLQNIHPVGAQRHADSDFAGAPLHRICGDAIKSDGRQHQRQQSKQRRQLREHLVLREIAVHLSGKAHEIDQRQVRIHLGEGAPDLRFESGNRALRLQHRCVQKVGAIFESLEARVVVHDVLGFGQKEHWRDLVGWARGIAYLR